MTKKINLLLISPPIIDPKVEEVVNFHGRVIEPNLAIPAILGYLKTQGYSINHLDISFDDLIKLQGPFYSRIFKKKINENFINYVLKDKLSREVKLLTKFYLNKIQPEKFDLIGFSIFSSEYLLASLLLSKIIKKHHPYKKIVVGGAFVKFFHESLYPYDFIDYLAIGDGEKTLSKLIDFLSNKITNINAVPSLVYRQKNKFIKTKTETIGLDDSPLSDFSELKKKFREKNRSGQLILPYQLSRGCNNKCSFCNFCFKEKIEFKAIRKIIKEISYLKQKYNPDIFHFVNANVNNDEGYLEQLCDEIISNSLQISWCSFARPNIKGKIITKMQQAGCKALLYGVETGSSRINSLMKKGFTVEEAEKCLRETSQRGIKTIVFFLFGFPTETLENIQESINFYKRNKAYIDEGIIFWFMLRKHSTIFNNPKKFGLANIRPIRVGVFNHSFAFDEIPSLPWKEKIKQTNRFINIFIKETGIYSHNKFNSFETSKNMIKGLF